MSLNSIMRSALRKAGLDQRLGSRGLSLFRHTLATRMLGARVSIKTIGDILGHTSTESTFIYTKVDIAASAFRLFVYRGGALMNEETFSSPLASQIQRFLQFKRAAGCCYNTEERKLRRFDRFLRSHLDPDNPVITDALARAYITPHTGRTPWRV